LASKWRGEQRYAAYLARVALQKFPHFWVVGVASLIKLEFTRIRGSRACQELAVELDMNGMNGNL
jgi:hypothetical protein